MFISSIIIYFGLLLVGYLLINRWMAKQERPIELRRLPAVVYVTITSVVFILPDWSLRPYALAGFFLGIIGTLLYLLMHILYLLEHPFYKKIRAWFEHE